MGNLLKYSTTTPQNALRKGTVAVGVEDENYGPTSTSGWYSNIAPDPGKYVIYKTAATGDPDVFTPQDNNELYQFVRMQGGGSSDVTSIGAALSWIASQSNLLAVNFDYESIDTDGLVLNLDCSQVSSYPTVNNNVMDLSGEGANTTKNGDVGFHTTQILPDSTDAYGNFLFNGGTNSRMDFRANDLEGVATIEMWCKIGTDYNNHMFMGWQYYDVYSSGGNIGFNTGNSDVYGFAISNVDIVDTWTHFIFEMRSDVSYTNNKIYVNGVEQALSQKQGSEAASNRNFNSGNGYIASWGGGGYNMPMECAVFRVYNKSLSQDEITHNYNSTKGRYQNLFLNGNFQFGINNFSSGTANTSVTYSGSATSMQFPQVHRRTFVGNKYVEVDTTKSYRYVVTNRTLTKGGVNNDVLSGGHMGYITYDEKKRFIDLRMCGGISNTRLSRPLRAGDEYAYVETAGSNWYSNMSGRYYFRHFCIYPASSEEFGTPWEYTRLGYGNVQVIYNEVVDIGGGETRIRFADRYDNLTPYPDIGYETPAGTPVMNGRAGGTYSYVFYPTTAPYGEWKTHTSPVFTGENRNSGRPFRYGTKFVRFMHLINYAVPNGTDPMPIALLGNVTLEQVQV